MFKGSIVVLLVILSFQLHAQDNCWFVLDSEYDLIWLSKPEILDIDGDGINEFTGTADKWSANYILKTDIVFDPDSSVVDWNGDGFVNDQDADGLPCIGTEETPFTGFFNGGYHTIHNLYKKASSDRIGLFGVINGATIENLRLENIRIYSDDNYNGGIVGRATEQLAPGDSNIIRHCSVSGLFILSSTTNNLYTGGIIGRTDNTHIRECASFMEMYAIGDSLVNRRVGGIVGQIQGDASVKDSYSVSLVSAYEQSGLLVARSYDDAEIEISNSYAAGSIQSTSDTAQSTLGVFAGVVGSPLMSSCYYDADLSSFPGVGESDGSIDISGLTSAQFSDPLNFTDWDFEHTWQIEDVDGVMRPRLIWEENLDSPSTKIPCPPKSSCLAPVLQWERTKLPSFVRKEAPTEFSIYPNPASRYLVITTKHYPVNFHILNMLGQKTISGSITSNRHQIDIQDLPSGVFILNIENRSELFIIHR